MSTSMLIVLTRITLLLQHNHWNASAKHRRPETLTSNSDICSYLVPLLSLLVSPHNSTCESCHAIDKQLCIAPAPRPQVFEQAVSGMKELFGLVRTALEAAPIVSMEEAAKAHARSCTYQDTTTLKNPNRDRFRILGYQHPRKMPGELPGELLMKIEDKADSTGDQDISPWFPDQGLNDPVVYPVQEPAHLSMHS